MEQATVHLAPESSLNRLVFSAIHGLLEIAIDVEPIPGGVLVVETSANPQVGLLIRQHARRAVSEFVAQGMARAMRPTPLPSGYRGS
jgi:hypothetical protein